MSATITVEEWISAINRAYQPSSNALTAGQWGARMGSGRAAGSAWVRTGLENGWLERAITTVPTITGNARRVVGFRLVKQEER
jgi:hypothetical protein